MKTVSSPAAGRNVLRDLDYRSSDLLLSNGVIWVEGPSDALYLKLFVDLYRQKHKVAEDINYCIQSLSTALWKHAGFMEFDWDLVSADKEEKIISLAKINHNHLLVIDSDDNYENLPPSHHADFRNGTGRNKARLIHESLQFASQEERDLESNFGDANGNKLFFWINEGTMEARLEYFVSSKGNDFEKYFDLDKTRGYFEKKNRGDNYSKSKMELAIEIGDLSMNNGLTFDDFALVGSALEIMIQRLLVTIKGWN